MALESFSARTNKTLAPCGLFVHPDYPYLAATPDSIVEGEDAIVEVKCPFSIKREDISASNLPYLQDVGSRLLLKRNHKYFYQVMGQLMLSRKKKCYFVVFTFKDLFIEEIALDEKFFLSNMLPKLKHFYLHHYRKFTEEKKYLREHRPEGYFPQTGIDGLTEDNSVEMDV